MAEEKERISVPSRPDMKDIEVMQENIDQVVKESNDRDNIPNEGDSEEVVTKEDLKALRREYEDKFDEFKRSMKKAKAQGRATISENMGEQTLGDVYGDLPRGVSTQRIKEINRQ